MGILAEQKQEVQKAVSNETLNQSTNNIPKIENVSRNPAAESVKETPVEQIFEPSQIIETVNRTANGNLLIDSSVENGVEISITPKTDKEIYSFDIFEKSVNSWTQMEQMKLVFTVNAHNGQFKSRIPLPKGQYVYFIKTQTNDMPFSVVFNF